MKQIIFIFSIFALIASSCGRQKQATTQENNETGIIPSQDYVGLWQSAVNAPDELIILEIDDNTIQFELEILRTLGAVGTAKIENDKITFTTDSDFGGTMEFNNNSISLTVDKSERTYPKVGTTWNFPIRVENREHENKLKYYKKFDDGAQALYEDGTAQNERFVNGKTIYLTKCKYKEFPTYVEFDNDNTWELFDDFGNINTNWKIFNYQKVNSQKQITDFEIYNSKKHSGNSVQSIDETCLLIMPFETREFANEDSDEAQAYFSAADDWNYYASETITQFWDMIGIKDVIVKIEAKYLLFPLANKEKIVVDIKKGRNFGALLYRKGYMPIKISLSGESEEGEQMIYDYLREDEQ